MYIKIIFCSILLCFIYNFDASAKEICDKSKCPGPIKYYEEIKCKPIYENPGDCCASSYDCSHLDQRVQGKCYIGDRVYNPGDVIDKDIASHCNYGCFCSLLNDNSTTFTCVTPSCVGTDDPNCYYDHSDVTQCCGAISCPNATNKVATCEVNGKIYRKGEFFLVPTEPEKECICLPGYEGKNIEPFCKKRQWKCGIELFSGDKIINKCAPAYYPYDPNNEVDPDCAYDFKCKNENDILIKGTNTEETSDKNTCILGNLTMKIGDKLINSGSDYFSKCLRCSCEVPPTPTCKYLPKKECFDRWKFLFYIFQFSI